MDFKRDFKHKLTSLSANFSCNNLVHQIKALCHIFMSNLKYPIKAYLISVVLFELKQKGIELCCTD